MAAKYGYMPKREDIEVIGDIESLKRKFFLKRNFWNHPALAAFHSKRLTYLFYFSRWAWLLHDVMYRFRESSIQEFRDSGIEGLDIGGEGKGNHQMIIEGFIWFADIADKLETKHGVTTSEAENIFTKKPLFNKIKKGVNGNAIVYQKWE